jgi:outer membrane protein TolC
LSKETEQMNLYRAQITEGNQVLRLLVTSYSNSKADFEEVLQMQQQLLKYQKKYISANTNYHIAQAELDYLSLKND